MGWKITKEFALDYGHRVWSQQLNKDYSIDGCLACRHLHGHRMTVLVELEADELQNGMVTDFKHLNWFKQFLDDVVDHKFIIDMADPLFDQLTGLEDQLPFWYAGGWATIPLKDDPVKNELWESFVIVDFIPTSENIAKWFYGIVKRKMGHMNIKVSKVTVFETPKSKSEYGE